MFEPKDIPTDVTDTSCDPKTKGKCKTIVQTVVENAKLKFIDLLDTPNEIEPLKLVRGNASGTLLEFVEAPSNTGGGSYLVWNQEDADAGDYNIDTFVSHIDKIWRSKVDNNTVEPSLSATTFWAAQSVETLANAVLLKNVTSNIASGATPSGTLFPIGMSFTEYVEKKEITTYYPVLNAPSFSLADNQPALLEVGSIVDVGLTFNFNRGTVVLQGVTQNPRAGVANSYTINGTTQSGNTLTVDDYEVTQGINTFTGDVSYDQGAQPKDSNNADSGTPLSAGTSPTQTTSFEGVYPLYATTANITTATEQPLVSMLSANNTQLTLVGETGDNKQFFDIPDAWLTARPLSYINYFNTISGQWDVVNRIGDFAVTNVTNGGIGYKRRTYTGIDRGSILIRLGF